MSEKLTARERYEADKARLDAKREANNAKYAAQREEQKAARAKIAADYQAKTAEADERLHDDIDKSKAELKQTWAEYASDRRARKEAKQAKKDAKRQA